MVHGDKDGSQDLLPDDVWAQLPPAAADRRAVGAALLAFVLMAAAVVVADRAGVIAPRLSYEGGSFTTANADAHTLTVRAVVHNDERPFLAGSGRRPSTPPASREHADAAVTVGAHETRTVVGVVHVEQLRGDATLRSPRPDGATTSSCASSACSAFPPWGSTACSTISCSRSPAGSRAETAVIVNGSETAFPYSSTRR